MSEWIQGNRYLTESEMDSNALLVYGYLDSLGYSLNAVSAILGNMVIESNINPQLWESLDYGNFDGGYGLCQWTPATKLVDWLAGIGISDYTDGYHQLKFLDEYDGQWGNSGNPNAPGVNPPMSWDEFKVSTLAPSTLASYFMYYWERPSYDESVNKLPVRMEKADYYYQYLSGVEPPQPVPHGKFSLLLLLLWKRSIERC